MAVSNYLLISIELTLLVIKGCAAWPEGTYGLPMPVTGCPLTNSFDWEPGSRTQRTEPGSHALNDVHLAGISATDTDPADKMTSNYCIKTSFPKEEQYEWQRGRYCVYKRDKCPHGFLDGWIYWDDSVPYNPLKPETVQGFSGTLPSGTYDRNTRIYFCCRKDGYSHMPITLPQASPFYLLRYGDACQQVEGMAVTEEWVYWAGEDTVNWDSQDGVFPYHERSSYPHVYTRLFYCYYEPKPPSSRLKIILMITYVIIALAGFLFLVFLIVCIVQRCVPALRKNDSSERNHNAESVAPMLPTAAAYQAGSKPTVTMVTANDYEEAVAMDRQNIANAYIQSTNGTAHNAADDNTEGAPLRSRDTGNAEPSAPSEHDLRPISLPPSYDEVMARVRPGDAPN